MALARVLVGIIQIGACLDPDCCEYLLLPTAVSLAAVISCCSSPGLGAAEHQDRLVDCSHAPALGTTGTADASGKRQCSSLTHLHSISLCNNHAVHYPVNHFPARNAIRDLLVQLTGRSFEGWRFNTAEVLAFYAATLVLSLVRHGSLAVLLIVLTCVCYSEPCVVAICHSLWSARPAVLTGDMPSPTTKQAKQGTTF